MPEIPDLVYIQDYLNRNVTGKVIQEVKLLRPVVLRMGLEGTMQKVLPRSGIIGIARRGPFLQFELRNAIDMIINLMLAGSIQHQRPRQRVAGSCCVSILLDDGSRLNLCDPELMMKVYVVAHNATSAIPKYDSQGLDVLSEEFTLERFLDLTRTHRRKQIRVFLRDHSALSAIGNAYADEILFDARIHPKTFVGKLSTDQVETLFRSIRSVLRAAIDEVAKADQPIEKKVRGHLKVRNRKGQPCPRCGAKIRREGVRGHDVFFCPSCQPATRKLFLDWSKISPSRQERDTST